jgi:DNA-binding MltR family transcriptional regulator
MIGPLLYVYRLPLGQAAEFEVRLHPDSGQSITRREVKDRVQLLALLEEYEADGVYQVGSLLIPLSVSEIVERCCALANENSGPVCVSVRRDTKLIISRAQRSINEELSGDSARAAAIVGCALLDERLRELLSEFLVQNEDGGSDLLSSDDSNAPLGTFGSRIVAAYAVGLIEKNQRDALRQLKKVRNAFAHQAAAPDFRDQAIAAHCKEAAKLCSLESPPGKHYGPRELFQGAVAFLAGIFEERKFVIQSLGMKGTFHDVWLAVMTHLMESPGWEEL